MNRQSIIICIFILITLLMCFLGCDGAIKSLEPFAKDRFENIVSPETDALKQDSINKEFAIPIGEARKETLAILIQRSIYLKIRNEDLFFCLFVEGVQVKKGYQYMEFPFLIYFEEDCVSNKTKVYVYPLISIFKDKESKKTLELRKTAFSQKAEEILQQISIQLSAKDRWPWLEK